MEENAQQSVFEIVLASTVHDMKNSLGMLLNAIDRVVPQQADQGGENQEDFNVIQYEAKRTNNALVKLLSLYKIDKQELPLNSDFHFLEDFIDEQLAEHQTLLQAKNINLSCEIEEDLEWSFDENLLSSVVNDVITNTIRYTKTKIVVRAYEAEACLYVEIADDGDGYPSFMVENPSSYALGVNFSTGSTGLGLYFASCIAALHRNGDVAGSIDLLNGGELGGGIFRIILP